MLWDKLNKKSLEYDNFLRKKYFEINISLLDKYYSFFLNVAAFNFLLSGHGITWMNILWKIKKNIII